MIVGEDEMAGLPPSVIKSTRNHRFSLSDASTIDVYSNCHSLILIINPFSLSSLSYAREKIDELEG